MEKPDLLQDAPSFVDLCTLHQHAMRYYRLWIYACNIVLALATLIFAIFALSVLVDPRTSLLSGVELYRPTFVYAYIALALQCGILQAIGCIGALRLNKKLLNAYWTILLVLMIGDILVGLVWIFRLNDIKSRLRPSLLQRLNNEYPLDDSEFAQIWNWIQTNEMCCGVDNHNDFQDGSKLPSSCCKYEIRIEKEYDPDSGSSSESYESNDHGYESSSRAHHSRVHHTHNNKRYQEFRRKRYNDNKISPNNNNEYNNNMYGSRNINAMIPRPIMSFSGSSVLRKKGEHIRQKNQMSSESSSNHRSSRTRNHGHRHSSSSSKNRESKLYRATNRPKLIRSLQNASCLVPLHFQLLFNNTAKVNLTGKDVLETWTLFLSSTSTPILNNYSSTDSAILSTTASSTSSSGSSDHFTFSSNIPIPLTSELPDNSIVSATSTPSTNQFDSTQGHYYIYETQFKDGCADKIIEWLDHSTDVLFVIGFCVIVFLKACFLALLRYEIKEMIQKIRLLNGEENGANAAMNELIGLTSIYDKENGDEGLEEEREELMANAVNTESTNVDTANSSSLGAFASSSIDKVKEGPDSERILMNHVGKSSAALINQPNVNPMKSTVSVAPVPSAVASTSSSTLVNHVSSSSIASPLASRDSNKSKALLFPSCRSEIEEDFDSGSALLASDFDDHERQFLSPQRKRKEGDHESNEDESNATSSIIPTDVQFNGNNNSSSSNKKSFRVPSSASAPVSIETVVQVTH